MLIKNAKLLFVMTVFETKRLSMFPTEVLALIISRMLDLVMLIAFWSVVAKYAPNNTIDIRQIISYFLIKNGISTFFFTEFGIGGLMLKLIKAGGLSQLLLRPCSALLAPWAERIGRNSVGNAIGFLQIVGGVVLVQNIGGSPPWVYVAVVISTLAINLSFNFILGTLGLYFVEASGVRNMFRHVSRLLGGGLMPLYLMPAGVAHFLQLTPFASSGYTLTLLLQGSDKLPEPPYIIIGLVWSVVLMWFALWFWRRSLAQYEAIGL